MSIDEQVDQPAFPRTYAADGHNGMLLRDYFAAQALAGLCANPGGPFQACSASGWTIVNCTPNDIARQCYELADAMFAVRSYFPPTEYRGPNCDCTAPQFCSKCPPFPRQECQETK